MGAFYRGRSGKAVGLGGIMHQSLAAASAALVCGSIASASGVIVQIAGHEPDGKSVIATVSLSPNTIATVPLSPSTTPSTIVSPPSLAMTAPDNRQDSPSPSNPPQ